MNSGTDPGQARALADRRAIEATQEAFLGALADLEEPLARYAYLVGLGSRLEPLPAELRREDTLVEGCLARAWFIEFAGAEAVHFRAWSDSRIVAGLLALLLAIYDGRHPRAILEARPLLAAPGTKSSGLARHLLPGREDGVRAVHERILATARRALALHAAGALPEAPSATPPVNSRGGPPPSPPSAP